MPPSSARLLAALLAASLAGCSSDVNPMRDAFVAAGVGAEPPKPQDFVARSRPGRDSLDYRAVTAAPAPRQLRSKTAGEVAAAEAEMNAARALNEQSAAAANAAAGAAAAPAN